MSKVEPTGSGSAPREPGIQRGNAAKFDEALKAAGVEIGKPKKPAQTQDDESGPTLPPPAPPPPSGP